MKQETAAGRRVFSHPMRPAVKLTAQSHQPE